MIGILAMLNLILSLIKKKEEKPGSCLLKSKVTFTINDRTVRFSRSKQWFSVNGNQGIKKVQFPGQRFRAGIVPLGEILADGSETRLKVPFGKKQYTPK